MKVTIRVMIEAGAGAAPVVREVARVEREALEPATLGLTLAEAKTLLQETQRTLVEQQVTTYLARHRACPACGAPQACKDTKTARSQPSRHEGQSGAVGGGAVATRSTRHQRSAWPDRRVAAD